MARQTGTVRLGRSREARRMIERARALVREHKVAVLAILLVLIVGIAYAVGRYSASDQAAAEKSAGMT